MGKRLFFYFPIKVAGGNPRPPPLNDSPDRVSPHGDLLTHAGMTSLYNMRLQDIAIFMFKIRNRLLPYNILELFSLSPSNYNPRNLRNSDFHVQRLKTVKYGNIPSDFLGHFYGQN